MHSTFSDGVYTPRRLVEEAAAAGVNVAAITDHDSLEGCDSLKGQELPVRLIPGVELSLRDMPGLHLLGYGLGEALPLRQTVAHLARQRRQRGRAMVERLCALGMPMDAEKLLQECEGSLGRPHIARAMVQLGYVQNVQAAFEMYLGEGRPAYVAGERLSMGEALQLMRRSGFVPVLAHPYELKKDEMTLRVLVRRWADQGLQGMEVYHPSVRGKSTHALVHMARSMGLLTTGGSDFHQMGDKHGAIGSSMPAWETMHDDVQALLQALYD